MRKYNEAKILELFRSGMKAQDIANRYGCSKQTVYRYLSECNEEPKREYRVYAKEEYLDELKKYVMENRPNREIAEIFGVSNSTVIKWIRDNNLRGLRSKHKEKSPEKAKKKAKEKIDITKLDVDLSTDFNANRNLCRKCVYRSLQTNYCKNKTGCDYILHEGHSRGCPVERCTRFVKGKRRIIPREKIAVGGK